VKTGEETGGKHAAFDYGNVIGTQWKHSGIVQAWQRAVASARTAAAWLGCCCCGRQSRSSRHLYHTQTTTGNSSSV